MSDYRKFTDLVIKLNKVFQIQFAPLYKEEKLYHLTVLYCEEDIDLSIFTEFKNIEELAFQNCSFTKLDLRPLEILQNLKSLRIINCPRLEELILCNFSMMKHFVEFIINQANLRFFSGEKLKDAPLLRALTLKQIGNSSQIENFTTRFSWWIKRRYYQDCENEGYDRYDLELVNYESDIQKLDISFIADHRHLKFLNVSYNQGVKKYVFPDSPPLHLVQIDFSFNSLSHFKVESFVSPTLKSLKLARGGIQEIDLHGIESAHLLREIILRENLLEEVNLDPLQNLTRLEVLDFSRNRLKRIDLSPLRKLCNLRVLILESNDLETIDLHPLSNLRLQQLYFGDNKIRKINLEPLRTIKDLRVLRLTRNCLSEIDLNPLQGCPLLQKIQIARNQLRRLTLAPLQGMQHLNEINLDRNPFQELNLDALRTIPQIDFIDLTEVSTQSKIDITPLLENHTSAWVNLSPEDNFSLDVKKIKDINLDGNSLIEHPAILKAIDFEKSSKDLIDSRTTLFALKAIEHHDDIVDLLTRRLIEERGEVSRAILRKVRELRKEREEDNRNSTL